MSGGYGTDALEVTVVATTSTPSPSSPVNLCNSALADLGQMPIVSLADDTDSARICLVKWPEVRDAVLRLHRWRCLTRRAQLARLAEAPSHGYLYAYALPSDCFRVLEAHFPATALVNPAWAVEGRTLLIDEAQAYVSYIAYDVREDNVSLFDSSLTAVIVARLAAEISPALKSADRFASLWSAYERKFVDAKAVDVAEASRPVVSCMTLLGVR